MNFISRNYKWKKEPARRRFFSFHSDCGIIKPLAAAFVFCIAAAPTKADATRGSGLTLRVVSPISFGKFTYGGAGSIMVDAHSGACRVSGGAVLIKPLCAQTVIELRGEPGDQVLLNLPPLSVLQNRTHPGSTLTLRDFTLDRDNPFLLGPDGRATVRIGASVSGSGRPRAGDYLGFFLMQATLLK